MKKYQTLAVLLVLTVVGTLIWLAPASPKCPDDFNTPEESLVAFEEWSEKFYAGHLEATVTDFYEARRAYYELNGCRDAVERMDSYLSE